MYVMSDERRQNLVDIAAFSASFYVFPLFLAFGIMDWIYYPKHLILFISLRIATVVCIISISKVIPLRKSLTYAQIWATIFVFCCSLPINLMLVMVRDSGSPYYAGLMLVLVGMSSGFRFTTRFYFLNVALTVLPFAIQGLFLSGFSASDNFFLNFFFIVGTLLISTVSRFFNERLYQREFNARSELVKEVEHRDEKIQVKTQEALKLLQLSNHFSPQVVHAIKTGNLDLKAGVHRSQICAIFIDIVNSTERVARIDKDNIHKVISFFMEDTIKTLLKYDITIDKFLGDGVLAFSNDPIKHVDYVERVVMAALEIRTRIRNNQSQYMDHWLNELKIRIGVALGFANVGFYGSDQYYKSYTAIGPVINMASRLCGEAQPSQILLSQDVVNEIATRGFSTNFIGKKTLKGFEGDVLKVHELLEASASSESNTSVPECPHCRSILHLDTDAKGIFVFKCRTCEYIIEENDKKKIA